MKTTPLPEHDHIACCACGRYFPRPWHMVREGLHTCPGCAKPATKRGGYEPMMQIEAGEHQRLLQLYYALFEHTMAPTNLSAASLRNALHRCNSYFEGGSPCH